MKFFLPSATSSQQAERVYLRIVDRLKCSGLVFNQDRIYKVVYREHGQSRSETVGVTSANGEIVLAIFKNDTGYLICTYSTGAVWGDPTLAQYLLIESAEKFVDE